MKKSIIAIGIAFLLGFNFISCKEKANEDPNNKFEENKITDNAEQKNNNKDSTTEVNDELKRIMISSARKYFDIDIKEDDLEYSTRKDIDDNILGDLGDSQGDEEVYVFGKIKNNTNKLDIENIAMEYDKETNTVLSLAIGKSGKVDQELKLSMEEAMQIAEKYIKEKELIPEGVKINEDSITNIKGSSVVDISYVINSEKKDIEIGINNSTKEVIMFNID